MVFICKRFPKRRGGFACGRAEVPERFGSLSAYLLVLMAMQMSKVSYVVAFRQVGALFGAGMGIFFLKESQWKTRLSGALILTLGLVLIGLAKQ